MGKAQFTSPWLRQKTFDLAPATAGSRPIRIGGKEGFCAAPPLTATVSVSVRWAMRRSGRPLCRVPKNRPARAVLGPFSASQSRRSFPPGSPAASAHVGVSAQPSEAPVAGTCSPRPALTARWVKLPASAQRIRRPSRQRVGRRYPFDDRGEPDVASALGGAHMTWSFRCRLMRPWSNDVKPEDCFLQALVLRRPPPTSSLSLSSTMMHAWRRLQTCGV